MEITRRNLIGAGVALGAGMASKGVLAQAPAPPKIPVNPAANGSVPMPRPVNSHTQPSSVDLNYKPRRVNKCIELLEDGQPIYYNGHFAGLAPSVDAYQLGTMKADTYEDLIDVEFEHGALDFLQLAEFMRGLVAGGPTRSGHRTPAVYVTLPIIGLDETYARANSWIWGQALDCGVHGFSICHSRNTAAIEVTMQMGMRYPFERAGLQKVKYDGLGLRGSWAIYASEIWGVGINEYCHLADLWPYNPKGEIMTGIKIEDKFCDQTAAETLALPGCTWCEWGPGDRVYSIYGLSVMPETQDMPLDTRTRPEMVEAHDRVLGLCKKNKVNFLNLGVIDSNSPDYVVTQIKQGAMVLESPEEAAIIGREYTKRKMPV
jgi:4-hydroxy-2-oxoheptanedioate aldolase